MKARVVAAVVALVAVGSGCAAGSSATVGADGSTLSIGLAAEPQNFDFTRTDGAAIPQVLLYNVNESLVKLDDQGRIVPLLAESWTVSDDRRTYDFQLRHDVTFANGAPFTAQDVRFSIERVKTAWTVSLKSAMDVVDHVEVVSPTHARVVLSRPSNGWLFAMTSRIGAMFSPTGVADLANKPVGTGPYVIAQRRRGDSIVLRENPGYWGRQPAFRTVVLKYIKDPTALNNALLSNGIDVIAAITAPDSIPQFEADNRFTVIQGTTNGEVTLAFNNARPPLNDVRVRRAIKLAIDRKALLDTAWAGCGTLIGSMVPPTDPWYTNLSRAYQHDPSRARALLAEAGATDLDLRLRIPNSRGRGRRVAALRGVSFRVAPGERFGIVGESGSGKSTLVRLLAALDRPTSGEIRFQGTRIDGLPERRLGFLRSQLQIVFQDPMGSLDPRMRVHDIVREPLGRDPNHPERVRELLDAVGLPADAGDRYPHQFSGGERQRISIARALAPRPAVLVADEPVSALDVSVRRQVLDLLADLVDRFELTLVFVSHDLAVVRHVCDTVAVMHRGEIVELGAVRQVYEEPQHDYTRELIAAAPSLAKARAAWKEQA